jgi:hypothetical protein
MREKAVYTGMTLTLLTVATIWTLSTMAQQNSTLIVNGQPSQVTIIEINGHPYADLEAFSRATNGSLAFNGNQITLTLPLSAHSSLSASVASATSRGLSRAFLEAGIEAMSNVREWRSALANTIQNGYPISGSALATYRDEATTNLRLASVAASTDSDRNALGLLNSEFNNMKQLSDKYVAKRQSLSYISPDSLQNDALDQKIVKCGHSLAAMAASGQFLDDGSCQ